MDWWESGWAAALGAIDALTADDLDRTIRIRGEALMVLEALSRSVTHTAYHVGQIVMMREAFRRPALGVAEYPEGKIEGS